MIAKGRLIAQGTIAELRNGASFGETAGSPKSLEELFISLVGGDRASVRGSIGSETKRDLTMLRTLRAFAWMRWRVLLNSLERTGARDQLERFSLAIDQLGPIIATILLVPSALGLAGLSAYAGYWVASGVPAMTFQTLRILLMLACGFAILAPMLMPSMEPTAMVRLLLLPIRQGTLYAAQAGGALSEPWILLSLPVALALPIGLAAGGAAAAAVVTLAAGALFVVCLIGLSTLSALLLHLVVRNRRRGELVALIFIVLVPALSVMPLLVMKSQERTRREHRDGRGRSDVGMPPWISRGSAIARVVVPSELFTQVARTTAAHHPREAVLPLALLVLIGGALHGIGLLTFSSLLKSPLASGGARRASTVGKGRASVSCRGCRAPLARSPSRKFAWPCGRLAADRSCSRHSSSSRSSPSSSTGKAIWTSAV